jgi:hypothetical protein
MVLLLIKISCDLRIFPINKHPRLLANKKQVVPVNIIE